MSRKQLKNYKSKDDVKNLTNRERAISKLLSLIFHLNNNGSRYGFSYMGYMFTLSKYNFSTKQWEELENHNFTQMDYNESYQIIRKINKRLYSELSSLSLGIDCDWEEDDDE